MLTITRYDLREPVEVILDATVICDSSYVVPKALVVKRFQAMKYLGAKWALHKSNAPLKKNAATAALNYYLGV